MITFRKYLLLWRAIAADWRRDALKCISVHCRWTRSVVINIYRYQLASSRLDSVLYY